MPQPDIPILRNFARYLPHATPKSLPEFLILDGIRDHGADARQSQRGTEFISPARECGVTQALKARVHSGTAPLLSHTHAANLLHCVFGTKERRALIPAELQEQLYAYLTGIADNLDFKILAAGGTSNHDHLLIGLPPVLTLAEVVQKLKANSSRRLGENGVQFEWQIKDMELLA